MKTMVACGIALAACLTHAEEVSHDRSAEEAIFYEKIAFPLAQAFTRLPQLPIGRGINTNDVVKWRCDYVWNTNVMVGTSLYLSNRMLIDLQVKGTNCAVLSFSDGHINPLGMAGREDPAKARFFSKMPNQFTDASALAFAKEFIKAAGNNLDNFRLTKAWQVGWGDSQDKKNYIPLPFYEYEWLRKDITEVEPGRAYPMVGVLISGITQKVIRYERLYLPIIGEFESAQPSDPPSNNEKGVNSIINSP